MRTIFVAFVFCNEEFLGYRSILLNHMARKYAFDIGLPDNIEKCSEFLCPLQKKLATCTVRGPSGTKTLQSHMKKSIIGSILRTENTAKFMSVIWSLENPGKKFNQKMTRSCLTIRKMLGLIGRTPSLCCLPVVGKASRNDREITCSHGGCTQI